MKAARGSAPDQARADLHVHSTWSDGLLSPAAVVDLAADCGIAVLALTDHDTLAGLPEASARADERGIELLAGVEISTTDARGGERHLLAYCVDASNATLLAALRDNAQSRLDRVQAMVDALASVGVDISVDDVLGEAGGSVGRPHVADALVRRGHVKGRQEAFDRWLADGRVAHVRKRNVEIGRAIEVAHEAGGVAVLAHPGRRWDPALIEGLVAQGLDGLEAMHPSNSPSERAALEGMASRWDLLVTGGSDCHGDREGIDVMRASRVPRELADRVVERAARRAESVARAWGRA